MALTKITNSAIADDIGLGGNPTTSTQTAGNSTTRIATTAFVSTAVANLVDSAPETLNTLAELATSIGNNATLSSTLTTSIATKLPLAGGTMTGNLNLGDNVRARFGLDSDLQIYHNTTNSIIADTGSGFLSLQSNGTEIALYDTANNANMGRFITGGAVNLFYNGNTKFQTTNTGINVTGTATSDSISLPYAEITSTSGSTIIDSSSSYLILEGSNIIMRNSAGNEDYAKFIGNGAVNLYHNNLLKIATTTTGIDVTGNIGVTGTVDGIDIAARDAVLTSTTTTAGAALPKAGGTMTGDLLFGAGGEIQFGGSNQMGLFTSSGTSHIRINSGIFKLRADDMRFTAQNGTTEYMRIDSNGNVGIGNTAPDEIFHILGSNAAPSPVVKIQSDDTANATSSVLLMSRLADNVNKNLYMKATLGNLAITGDSGYGKVGIGTTVPSEKLVVNVNSTGIKAGLILNNQHGYGSGVGVASTALQFGRDNTPDNGQTIITGQIYSGNEQETTSNPCFMAFSTKSGASPYTLTERMRIDSSGHVLIGKTSTAFGTAGISLRSEDVIQATRSAEPALEVNRLSTDGEIAGFYKDSARIGSIGVSSGSMYIEGNPATGKVGLTLFGSSIEPRDAGSASNGAVDLGATGSRFKDLHLSSTAYAPLVVANDIKATGSGGISFQTDEGTKRLEISDAGEVGIGLGAYADPRLKIKSAAGGDPAIHFDGSAANRGAQIKFLDNGSLAGGFIDYHHNGDKMKFGAGSSATPTMTVGDQVVGIGTDSPVTSLSLGASNTGISFTGTNTGFNSGKHAGIRGEETGTGHGNLAFDTFAGGSGGGERMVILASGNVGIGTSAPSNLLSLKGQGNNWNTSPAMKLWDSQYSKGWYVGTANNQAAGDYYIRSVTSESAYPVAANQQFTITQGGNVGIGTIAPAVKFQVNGTNASIGVIGTPKSDWYTTAYNGLQVADGLTLWGRAGDAHMSGNYYVKDVSGVAKDSYINTGYAHDLWFDNGSGDLKYRNAPSGSANGEITSFPTRLVIKNSGDVLIGSTTNLDVLSGTPKLQIGSGTGHASLQFYSGATSVNGIYFGDTSSANNDRYDGYIEYRHNDGSMAFRANGDSVLTLDSNGLMQGLLSRYTNSSNINTIMDDTDEKAASIGSSWTTLTYWIASQSGELRTTLGLYISSGSYYFNYRFFNVTKNTVVKMSDNSTDASHFYNANQTSNEGNVHHWQYYQLDLGVVDAGDEIKIQMQAATGTGVAAAGNGQIGYVKHWRFLSGKQVPVERDNGVMERPTVRGVMRQSQLQNGTGPVTHTIPIFLGSGTHNIFSILSGFSTGSMAVASIRYVALYAYAANNSGLGDQQATIRRGSSNTVWSVGSKTVHFETNGGSVSTPAFAWNTSGVLQMTLAGSVQIVGEVTITTYSIPGYKYGINV